MSKELARLLDDIQAKTDLTLDEIADKINVSRPHLSVMKKKGDSSKLEARIKERFRDVLQNQTLSIPNQTEYLLKNAARNHAMLRVILTALAEVMAHQKGESVTKILSELTAAVEVETGQG